MQFNGVYYRPPQVGAPGEIDPLKSYTFKYPRPPRCALALFVSLRSRGISALESPCFPSRKCSSRASARPGAPKLLPCLFLLPPKAWRPSRSCASTRARPPRCVPVSVSLGHTLSLTQTPQSIVLFLGGIQLGTPRKPYTFKSPAAPGCAWSPAVSFVLCSLAPPAVFWSLLGFPAPPRHAVLRCAVPCCAGLARCASTSATWA